MRVRTFVQEMQYGSVHIINAEPKRRWLARTGQALGNAPALFIDLHSRYRGVSMAAYTAIDALEKYFASEGPGSGWSNISLIGNADFTRHVRVATTGGRSVEQV
jgi:hypothetical protein